MRDSTAFIKFKETNLLNTIYLAVPTSIFMFMSFYFLDLLLKLENTHELLFVRLAMSFVSIITFVLSFIFRRKSAFIRVVPFFMVFCGTIYSAFLTHYAGGLKSTYWAGMSFVIVSWCCLFPQKLKTTLVTTSFFVLLYNTILIILNLNDLSNGFLYLIESNVFMNGSFFIGSIVSYVSNNNKIITFEAKQALEIEKEKTENLLLNILPIQIAERLKNGETTISDYFDKVAILFTDIVGFTNYCSGKPSHQIVEVLNEIFYAFDKKTEELGLEKIKTIGDGYMVMAGGLKTSTGGLLKTIDLGDYMINFINEFSKKKQLKFTIRVGIHIGSVTAGVIGKTKFSFDIWGDTVNIASRMESSGIPMEIHITEEVANLLEDKSRCTYRGEVDIKGKGLMKTYIIERFSQQYQK